MESAMKESSKNTLNQLGEIFEVIETVLDEWNSPGNLKFPDLMAMISAKTNWNEKYIKEIDPVIRLFIRRSPDYEAMRGAHGGIQRVTDKQKKEELKALKDQAKKQVHAEINTKIATREVLLPDPEGNPDYLEHDFFSDV